MLLTKQEYGFIVNYLGDRDYIYGIDNSVYKRFPDIDIAIKLCIENGDIEASDKCYRLTESGKAIRRAFRNNEKLRAKCMQAAVIKHAVAGKYEEACCDRNIYEKESIIPHGVTMGFGTDSTDLTMISDHQIMNYRDRSYRLDFTDLNNTNAYIQALRRFYIGIEIAGGVRDIDQVEYILREATGESINCPILNDQAAYLNPTPERKLSIYLDIKIRILNGIIKEWDGRFVDTEEQYNQITEYIKQHRKKKR